MTQYATIAVTAYMSEQGPIVTDHGGGIVTINVNGNMITGQKVGESHADEKS